MSGKSPTQLKRGSENKTIIWEPARPHPLDFKLIPVLNRLTHPGRQRYQRTVEVIADLQQIEHPSERFTAFRFTRSNTMTQGFKLAQKQIKQWRRTSQGSNKIKPKVVVAIAAIGTIAWLIRDVNSFANPIVSSLSQHFDIDATTWNQKPLSLKRLHTFMVPTDVPIEQMILTPNHQLITRSRKQIAVWDAQAATIVKTFEPRSHDWLNMTTSQDGTWLATVDRDRRVTVWDLASKRIIHLFIEPRTIVSLAISPNREMIATSDDSGTHRIRRIANGNIVQALASGEVGTTPLFTDADRFVYATNNHQIKIWNSESSQLNQVFAGHTNSISLLQANNGKLYSFGKDRALGWNVDHAELQTVFPAASAEIITAQMLKPDSQRLLTINQSGELQLWNTTSGQLLQMIAHLEGLTAISANGLLASYADNQLQIWRID